MINDSINNGTLTTWSSSKIHAEILDAIDTAQTGALSYKGGYNTTTNTPVFKSAGKQPAWINYMTNVNQVRGNFAIESNEMFMTLNRKYERTTDTGEIKDLTTYIDPRKFNNVFAMTNRDAQNFWVQIAVDITARRKMSAKIMPNL